MDDCFRPSHAEHTPQNPRFATVYKKSSLVYQDIDLLANAADVSREDILTLMLGNAIKRETAQHILDAFNRLTKKQVQLDQLDVKLIEEKSQAE